MQIGEEKRDIIVFRNPYKRIKWVNGKVHTTGEINKGNSQF